MRIISKFKDYYDIGASVGIDPAVVYNRMQSVIKADKKFTDALPFPPYDNYCYFPDIRMSAGVLGFCGKLYPVTTVYSNPTTIVIPAQKYNVFSDPKNALNYMLETIRATVPKYTIGAASRRIIDKFYSADKRLSYCSAVHANYDNLLSFGKSLSGCGSMAIHHEYKTPIFLILYDRKPTHIVINPQLKGFGFASIVDPFTAFQEVSMFVGGVLSNVEQAPQITDDVVLLESKGFDKKTSFRTMSPGKKSKKKGN